MTYICVYPLLLKASTYIIVCINVVGWTEFENITYFLYPLIMSDRIHTFSWSFVTTLLQCCMKVMHNPHFVLQVFIRGHSNLTLLMLVLRQEADMKLAESAKQF
jgi:hypothetical protein